MFVIYVRVATNRSIAKDDTMPIGNGSDRAESRYQTVSRRAFIKKAGLAAGAIALFPSVAGCNGEPETFGSASSTAAPTAPPTTSTTLPPSTTTTATNTTAPAERLPVGSELLISFTYAASDTTSRVRNPYVAVWVEDAAGELVNTVALWFLQSNKGTRWISDLRRWHSVDGSDETIDTISSATRTPGDYAVIWNLVDLDGSPITPGDYYICIESAREHGPYSLVREPVAISTATTVAALPSDGELGSATVAMSTP